MNAEQAIRERSYLIWEREGRPEGRNLEHWLLAEAELRAEPRPARVTTRARTRPPEAAKRGPVVRKRPATREA